MQVCFAWDPHAFAEKSKRLQLGLEWEGHRAVPQTC